MKKTPKGITYQDSGTMASIETSNYNESVMFMQIFLLLLPLLAANVYLILNPLKPQLFIVSGSLLAAVIYFIIHNAKDRYRISITNEKLKVVKGMHNAFVLELNLADIKGVKIKRKYGKVYTHARSGTQSETPNTDELIIDTGYTEIVLTNSLLYSEQLFIKTIIEERLSQRQ